MARPKENNFTRPIRDKLAQSVAYRYSKPDCRVPTIGPRANNKDSDSIGRAAHICAASSGGPRFDPYLSPEQIRSFENGIWLCANHASEIDSDYSRYSKADLLTWKEQALALAREEKGHKLPSKNDAVETLLVAMGHSVKQIPSMIESVHLASAHALEVLDPRFKVKSSYFDECQQFQLLAKELVTVNFSVKPENPALFKAEFTNWISYGEDLVIDTSRLDVNGSRLLKEVFSQNGRLTISPHRKNATLKVSLNDQHQNKLHFEDLIGHVSVGETGFKFKGISSSALLSIELITTNIQTGVANCKIAFDLDKWDKVEISKLSYFEKYYSLFNGISKGSCLSFDLEVEGNHLISTKNVVSDNQYIRYISSMFEYTNAGRKVSKYLNKPIVFNYRHNIQSDEYYELLRIANVIGGATSNHYGNLEIRGNISFDNQDAIDAIQRSDSGLKMVYVEDEGQSLIIFGIKCNRPSLQYELINIGLIPTKKNMKFKIGKTVEIRVVPLDHFLMTTTFLVD